MSDRRFEVRFDPDAFQKYQGLDQSVVIDVDKALEKLDTRADQIGKSLGNKDSTKLHGCKEIKLRRAGLNYFSRDHRNGGCSVFVYVLSIV